MGNSHSIFVYNSMTNGAEPNRIQWKMAKKCKQTINKKNHMNTNKQINSCSASSSITVMQIKTTMRHQFQLIRKSLAIPSAVKKGRSWSFRRSWRSVKWNIRFVRLLDSVLQTPANVWPNKSPPGFLPKKI